MPEGISLFFLIVSVFPSFLFMCRTLPSSWAVLEPAKGHMQELTLDGCNLTGTLPAAWALEGGRFEWVSYIDLHDNALVSSGFGLKHIWV